LHAAQAGREQNNNMISSGVLLLLLASSKSMESNQQITGLNRWKPIILLAPGEKAAEGRGALCH